MLYPPAIGLSQTVSVNTAALVYVALILAGLVTLLVADWRHRRCGMPGFRPYPSCSIPVPTRRRVCPHCSCALGES